VAEEVAVSGLFGGGDPGDDVEGDAAFGHPGEGVDDLGEQGWCHQAGPVGEHELDPVGDLGQCPDHRDRVGKPFGDAEQQGVDAEFLGLLDEVAYLPHVELAHVVGVGGLGLSRVRRRAPVQAQGVHI
jgi:hypothetical protein